MLDTESQMLDALDMLYRFLEEPVDGLNEKVRVRCFDEVKDLSRRTLQQMILPDPKLREELVIRHMLDRDAFPLPIAVAVERYLNFYERAHLPVHERPIVDTIPTRSEIPLVRVRGVHWEEISYEASTAGQFLTWTHLLVNGDLVYKAVSNRIREAEMRPCYERDTASLHFKLFSRWNLADTIPRYHLDMQLNEGIYLALHPNGPATDFLVHFQFMLSHWVQQHADRGNLSLKEAALSYCTDVPADVFAELMPPLSQIVIVDSPNDTLYHFGSDSKAVHRMLRLWQPELA